MKPRKKRGKKIKTVDDVVGVGDHTRIAMPEWTSQPAVARFLSMREKLKDVHNAEELEKVKTEVYRLRDIALKESTELRETIRQNTEQQKMRFHASAPEGNFKDQMGKDWRSEFHGGRWTGDPMMYGMARAQGLDPAGGFNVIGPPDDILVWMCPECGNDKVNYKQLSRKGRRRIIKKYSFLTKGDVKRGLRYCIRCSTKEREIPMRKMPMGQVRKLREQIEMTKPDFNPSKIGRKR